MNETTEKGLKPNRSHRRDGRSQCIFYGLAVGWEVNGPRVETDATRAMSGASAGGPLQAQRSDEQGCFCNRVPVAGVREFKDARVGTGPASGRGWS